MNRIFIVPVLLLLCLSSLAISQTPASIDVQILKAEDARAYDRTIENLLRHTNPAIRTRAALAAGRIGSEAAIPALLQLLEKGTTAKEREMAAFALGEIESIAGADAILKALNEQKAETRPVGSVSHAQDHTLANARVSTRLVEAAGKIAAANPKDPKSKDLGEAILHTLEAEDRRGAKQSRDVVLMGLTAALRAKPDETNIVVAKFLTNLDVRVRADAANTLSRVKAKNANEALRAMLLSDSDAVARANAARALGAAEDKMAFDLLLEAATGDDDSRVRVSAIRSLGALKDAKAAGKLLERGEKLHSDYKKSKFANPTEKNELLEIAMAIGRLLSNSDNPRAIGFLKEFDKTAAYKAAEVKIALAQVSPKGFFESFDAFNRDYKVTKFPFDWRINSAAAQGLGELAKLEINDAYKGFRERAAAQLSMMLDAYYRINSLTPGDMENPEVKKFLKNQKALIFNRAGTQYKDVYMAVPDILRAYAAFKPEGSEGILLNHLSIDDQFIRAAAAELLADLPASKENVEMLKSAFKYFDIKDLDYDDARLAILDTLFKLEKEKSIETFLFALDSPDYLVRKKAFQLLAMVGQLQDKHPEIQEMVRRATGERKNQVLPYDREQDSKLGQVLNTDADYRRAIQRKNGQVKAVLTTEKGTFAIDLLPEDAPLTVDNFVKLAKSGYFNGLEVHRVVPNFVMQDGDPRGDGNGGPGWSIRCEINMIPYERGAVGMALSGKDTGGSQWFVTHSPQPHLDGGYTVFGRVNETDMKVVDNIVRGDKILSVRIAEGNLPRKNKRVRQK